MYNLLRIECEAGVRKASPGFFTEYKRGNLVISGVLPNSPAAMAGLQSGDTLLEVDHHALPFADIKPVWQEDEWHTIQLKRGSALLTEKIKPQTMQSILSRLPVVSSPLKPVSFPVKARSFEIQPFLSGMLLDRSNSNLVVDAVLRGSPAYRAGVRPGDFIVGTKTDNTDFLQYSSERKTVSFVLRRAGKDSPVTLRFVSFPELLESVAR